MFKVTEPDQDNRQPASQPPVLRLALLWEARDAVREWASESAVPKYRVQRGFPKPGWKLAAAD